MNEVCIDSTTRRDAQTEGELSPDEAAAHFFQLGAMAFAAEHQVQAQALCGAWAFISSGNTAAKLKSHAWIPARLEPEDCAMCIEAAAASGMRIVERRR